MVNRLDASLANTRLTPSFFVTNGSEYGGPEAYYTNHCALLGGELSTPSTYDETLSLAEYICSEARVGTNKGQSGAWFTDHERDMVFDTDIFLGGALLTLVL